MIKAIDANMYLYLFVENIAPIQEIDTANCIHFKLNSVVLNIHIDKKDNAKTNIIAFNSNHSIFRHDNFIGCFSADKIKMSARK